MTMNNYFHKHMLTHTLGRYHFKTIEEERIRLIQEKKTLADRITKGFKHDGRSISLCKTMKLSLPEVLPTVEEQKEATIDSNILKFSFGEKMVKFIITVLME